MEIDLSLFFGLSEAFWSVFRGVRFELISNENLIQIWWKSNWYASQLDMRLFLRLPADLSTLNYLPLHTPILPTLSLFLHIYLYFYLGLLFWPSSNPAHSPRYLPLIGPQCTRSSLRAHTGTDTGTTFSSFFDFSASKNYPQPERHPRRPPWVAKKTIPNLTTKKKIWYGA